MVKGKEDKKKKRRFIIWFWILFTLPVFSVLLFVLGVRMFADLPDTEALQNPKTNLATEVLSSDMKVLGKYFAENRTNVKFKDISPNVVNALIATEDARFYSHSGVDIRAWEEQCLVQCTIAKVAVEEALLRSN